MKQKAKTDNAATEVEPRRSVRSTKGQHTKSFDELEQVAPKRRQTKKSKKAQEEEEEPQQEEGQEDDEIIRCVCGATEQDDDSGEAWISCEQCFAWQHNVCIGVSSFEDEIPDHYWCEICKPENHTELLEGIAKGEKPWEARRKAHEEQKKKPRKGGRKAKAKRQSDAKDDADKEKEKEKEKEKGKESENEAAGTIVPAAAVSQPQPEESSPPAPEAAPEKKEAPAKGKRKAREESNDVEAKVNSEHQAVSSNLLTTLKAPKVPKLAAEPSIAKPPKYTPPEDLPQNIKELQTSRSGPARALKKSIGAVLDEMVKSDKVGVSEGDSTETMAETYALQIERAVYDTHPVVKGQKEYSQQIKSLAFNLKGNPELVQGLIDGRHTPPTLAVMTSAQLASAQQQREDAETIAKAEAQSTLPPQDLGRPRVRRTHKGEEIVEDESMMDISSEPPPLPPGGGGRGLSSSRQDAADGVGKDGEPRLIKNEPGAPDHPAPASPTPDGIQRTPTQSNFDIGKVFSSVRSSSVSQPRRPSAPIAISGPGEDADVDRMLQDENDSPPYSPTEESHNPDVVWRGRLAMSTIADFEATAKYIGGADFQVIAGSWAKLIPYQLTVAGRIAEQSATEYLCGLRYSDLTDIIVVSLEPASDDSRPEFNAMINYFTEKKRFGVVGDKAVGNVRDTYLIPVPPGKDNHPEFILNLTDNYIPKVREHPMMLAVFVWRSDPETIKKAREKNGTVPQPPTPTQQRAAVAAGQKGASISAGPLFSPATPQAGPFSGPAFPQSQTPVPIPHMPHAQHPSQTQAGGQTNSPVPAAYHQAPQTPSQGSPTVPQLQQPIPPVTQARPATAVQQGHAPPLPPTPSQPDQMSEAQRFAAQQAGQTMASEVLGPAHVTASTAQFLMPQAWKMSRQEWEVVRNLFEREPKARDDLQFLASLLEKEPKMKATASSASPSTPSAAAPVLVAGPEHNAGTDQGAGTAVGTFGNVAGSSSTAV